MNDARAMRRIKSSSGLHRNVEHLAQRQRLAPQTITQRLALDQLSRDKTRVLKRPDLVDGQDVGVIERRGGLGFLDETTNAVLVGCDLGEQNFQSDLSAKLSIFGKIHLAHTALADLRNDAVMTDGASDLYCFGHRVCRCN